MTLLRNATRLRLSPSMLGGLGLLLVLAVAPVRAATYWVSTSGNDGNSCSAAQNNTSARRTINGGIGCLNGGDTLIVRNGTYTETVNVWQAPSGPSNSVRTIIRAENTRGAIISPTFECLIMENQSNITVQGFVCDASDAATGGGGVETADLTNVTVQDLEILNQSADAFNDGSGGFVTTNAFGAGGTNTNVVLRNNLVHDIGMNCAGGGCCNECYGYGIYLSGSGYTLENNEFYNTSGWIVHGYPNGTGGNPNILRNNYIHDGGASLLLCRGSSQVYNNIVVGIGHMGLQAGAAIQMAGACSGGVSSGSVLYNNTIVGSAGDCINLGFSTNGQIRNNICYQNGNDAIASGGGGNQSSNNLFGTNPQFNGTGGGIQTYRLTSASTTAINQGTNTGSIASLVTTDISGATRPVGGAWDIGAWEFGGAVGPPTCPDCASCNASCTCPASCLPPEVASWWKFDEGVGIVANDSTGTRNMTVLPQSWGPGKVGPSALVCGAGQAPRFNMTSYSWLMWVQGTAPPIVTQNTFEDVLHNGEANQGSFGFSWSHSVPEARQSAWHRDAQGSYLHSQLTTALQGGLWYHIAATWDGTFVRAYLNGQPQITTPAPDIYQGTGNLAVCYNGSGNNFPGRIDNLKVYPNVLTPADILADYTATQGSVATRARPRVVRTE